MIDVKDIRTNPDALRQAILLRKVDPAKADLDRWLALDGKRRQLQSEIDALNRGKKELARLGKSDPDAARLKGQELRQKSRDLDRELGRITGEWQAILDWFPNWPHADMPHGDGEEDNIEEKIWIPGKGYLEPGRLGRGDESIPLMPKELLHASEGDFKPLHHAELAPNLGIDTLQAAQVSGSRFAYILGDMALVQYALTQLLIGELLQRGYDMIIPPLLVRERTLYGTSHFPEGRDQVYSITRDNVEEGAELFLVGSSEPTNFSYFMDRTLREAELPIKIFASTSCFRSEAGSWGKDVKGIKRVHQFDKIEMNAVCAPGQSEEIYAEFSAINEWLLQALELPYRVVGKCTGDAGYLATHQQRDMEVWLTGSGEYMEVMTDTNTTDYQARRLNIRYKGEKGGPKFCHTVNDTGCAMGRMLIAIIDNYQQRDGLIKVPEVLQGIVGKDFIEPRK
ncbi:MAG: serine--tRNA ligase [Gemmatimonadetes bacterium]|nr:serine--tRNA ligase [Gemmatimonadota bacterium]